MTSDLTLYLPAVDGTAGQSLVTNGTGDLYWATGAGVSMGSSIAGGASAGSVLFVDGAGNLGQDNPHFYWNDTTDRLGLGTSSPSYLLDVSATNTDDYLARIYNASSTAASGGGLSIRVDGNGALLNLNYSGTDVMTVTGAQTTFNNPVVFGAAGDVSMAYDSIYDEQYGGKYNL